MKIMRCPDCSSNDDVIKAGLRSTSKGKVQKYFCKDCETYFSDTSRSKTQYPEHVILYIRKALPEDGRIES